MSLHRYLVILLSINLCNVGTDREGIENVTRQNENNIDIIYN